MSLVAVPLFLAFWVKMRELDRKANEMAHLWSMFAKASEKEFTPTERESVNSMRSFGDLMAFSNACRQYVHAAK